MKKIIVLIAAALFCITAFAQSKGDMYVAGALGASFGTENDVLYRSGYSSYKSQPLGTSLSAQGEFAYFIKDNLRLSLALGVPFSSSPTGQDGETWLYAKSFSFVVNPNVAYYIPLADRFYYTPEVGVSCSFGTYKDDQAANVTYNTNLSGWDIYGHFLAFEFKVSERFALGVMAGTITYSYSRISDRTTDDYLGTGQFRINLNNSGIAARYYF